jgi:hypothetical protein
MRSLKVIEYVTLDGVIAKLASRIRAICTLHEARAWGNSSVSDDPLAITLARAIRELTTWLDAPRQVGDRPSHGARPIRSQKRRRLRDFGERRQAFQ